MPEYVKLTQEQLNSLVKNAVDKALKERQTEKVIYVPVERTVYVEKEPSKSIIPDFDLDEFLGLKKTKKNYIKSLSLMRIESENEIIHITDDARFGMDLLHEQREHEICKAYEHDPEGRAIALRRLDLGL